MYIPRQCFKGIRFFLIRSEFLCIPRILSIRTLSFRVFSFQYTLNSLLVSPIYVNFHSAYCLYRYRTHCMEPVIKKTLRITLIPSTQRQVSLHIFLLYRMHNFIKHIISTRLRVQFYFAYSQYMYSFTSRRNEGRQKIEEVP